MVPSARADPAGSGDEDVSPLAPATGAVLDWFGANGRDLPWRRTRDPWAVMVSELMLQQTQVARVSERWPAFLRRYPDPRTCAEAPRADLIAAWAGLGYNRRAVNLHRAAEVIVDRHGGRVPETLRDLLALPGIGPYTARAIRVFAFETDDGVLDTNVARILARTTGRPLDRRRAQELADAAVPPGQGWAWNQALLDIGSLHCRSGAPRCDRCPMAGWCRWRGAGDDADPAVGSAGVSTPQSRFEGSDRQGRGRLVDALRQGPVARRDLAEVMGWDDDDERAQAVARTVVADGLAVDDGDHLTLP
ncbi:MAG: A/G-specific adenine glycosylase [Actinomycetota bacterium]